MVNKWYITAYEPIYNSQSEIIGMLYVGVPQESVSSLRNAVLNTNVGETGYVYVLDSSGKYIISKDGSRDGEDISGATDAQGNPVIQEICDKALVLKHGEITEHMYMWKNSDDISARMKIARIMYFEPWDWIIGAGSYIDEFNGSADRIIHMGKKSLHFSVIILCSALLLTALIWLSISNSITKPLNMSVDFAKGMSKGDFTKSIELDEKNEIGELAGSLNTMRVSLAKMFNELIAGFNKLTDSSDKLLTISQQMSSGATQTSEKSDIVSKSAEEMSINMDSIASATEEASTNVDTVAVSSEQISQTINEMVKRTEEANDITKNAVIKAENANDKVNKLGDAAEDIGKFTEIISGIAEQTNLLALNATIEAARAGETGKGFAVVATEIKELAAQTTDATDEIKNKIMRIQGSTEETVSNIHEISDINKKINELVTTVGAAVQEQSSATNEIAVNVAQASDNMKDINQNIARSAEFSAGIAEDITEVNKASSIMEKNSMQVKQNADELKNIAKGVNEIIARFSI